MITHRPLLCKGPPGAPASIVVGSVATRVPPLTPDDTIAKAAETIRLSPAAAAPVAEDGRIVGIVTAEGLKSVLAGASASHVRALPVRTVMATDLLCLREGVTVEYALETFRDNGL